MAGNIRRLCATAIASMNSVVHTVGFLPEIKLIWVWMSDTVRADALQDAPVIPPMCRPVRHVMVGWVMYDARTSLALVWRMGVGEFQFVVHHSIIFCPSMVLNDSLTHCDASYR